MRIEEPPASAARAEAIRLVTLFRQSQCVRVAATLRLPELLGDGPLSDAELAEATSCDRTSLRRLLRTLVAIGLLAEDESGRYRTTPLGAEFAADRAGPAVEFFGGEIHWAAWQRLDHSVRTGERAFDLVHGMRNWELYARDPEWGARFDAAMRAGAGPVADALVKAYDFSRYSTLADVGGGDGTVLIAILNANPALQAILFDRPDVVERAEPRLREAGVLDRCRLLGGSFFETAPGADAYVMKSILHDWDDGSARAILERVRSAARAGAELLVVERVLPERPGPEDLEALLLDLNMMVNNGGRERTADEFRQLFESAGFRMQEVIPTAAAQLIVRGVAI